MFFDPNSSGFWERPRPVCRSCKQPVAPSEPAEELRFDDDSEHRLNELNGIYHTACARPYLSIKRALDALRWRHK